MTAARGVWAVEAVDNLLDTSVATGDVFHQNKSILSIRFTDLTEWGMTA